MSPLARELLLNLYFTLADIIEEYPTDEMYNEIYKAVVGLDKL